MKRMNSNNKVSDFLITVKDPSSDAAQQFSKTSMRIIKDGGRRVILVTSALPLEGKTFVAANLAASLARLPEVSAVLIDMDMKRPELHKLFGIRPKWGLTDYLKEKATLKEVLYQTPVPGLSLIPGGRTKGGPEVFSFSNLENLFRELKEEERRYVIVDSTPLLPFPEVDALVGYVDAVLLVVRYGKTQRDPLQRALGLLEKEKVMGIVFNDVDRKLLKYRYRYYR